MTHHVGLRTVHVADAAQDASIRTLLLYPSATAGTVRRFGPYDLVTAEDVAVAGRDLPLVVLSHGNGGSPWTLRDLAAGLAREGFVACLPEHPGNCHGDNHLAGTAANLGNRPRHLSLVVDAAFACPALGPRLAPGRVAVIGHSMGGYTALGAAGGRPWADEREAADGRPHAVPVQHDPRIVALVLLAPATVWFGKEAALADVRVPILMRSGKRDEITPPWHADIVRRGVADAGLVDHSIIAGAGHFSFMSPFPASMNRPDFPPSRDPPGFDRAAFQPILLQDIVEFLRRMP